MAGNTINMNLNVQDQGGTLKARTSEAKDLNKELEKAEKLAEKTFKEKAKDKFSDRVFPGGGVAGIIMRESEYGRARGVAGGTGASARDFAAQAQGLDGLVRLYATWAANVYAVGAAFNALSRAANVDNMITGMNQLGVASGVALGSLAKDLVKITDGAISMQEAMSATVKATASGLSATQLKQMGEVATKASRALGIDMTDALSRMTRGITKLEPELLDELGIFTKVGSSSEDYAKSIGKSAASLTDFEKRQAFANAALKEGLDKFGELDVAANPYDKLAAAITDLSQKTLSLVNTALGPLINILSSSPMALSGVLTLLGGMIIKQALPAIGQYKQALSEAAEASAAKAQYRADEVKKIEKESFQYILQMSEAEAEARVNAVEKAQKKIEKLRQGAAESPMSARAKEILAKTDPRTVTDEDRKYLRDLAKIEKGAGNIELAKGYERAERALHAWIKVEREHYKLLQDTEVQAHKNVQAQGMLSQKGITVRKAEAERKSSARIAAISEAVQNVSIMGVSDSWAKFSKQVDASNLGKVGTIATKAAGGIGILATATANIAGTFLNWLSAAGAVIGALSLVYSWIRKNGEQSKALSDSVDNASETYKVASQSIQKFKDTLTFQGIEAFSNAMAGLSDSTIDTIDKLNKFSVATKGIDAAWEGLKSFFGMSQQDIASEAISQNIVAMLESVKDPAIRSEFEATLKSALDVTALDFATLDDAIESIDPKVLKSLEPVLNKLSIASRATSASVTAIKDSFAEVSTAYNALNTAIKPNDPISNFAAAIAKQANILQQAFGDAEVAAATFQAVMKDTSKLAGFPPQMQADILARSKDFETLTSSIKETEKQLKDLDTKIIEATGLKDEGAQRKLFEQLNNDLNLNFEDLDLWKQLNQKFKLKLDVQEANTKLKDLARDLGQAAGKQMEFAFAVATKKVGSAAAQSALDQQKTLLSYLPKSAATIQAATKIEIESINIRIREIQAIYDLTKQLEISTLESKIDRADQKAAEAAKTGGSPDAIERRTAPFREEAAAARRELEVLKAGGISGKMAGLRPGQDYQVKDGKLVGGKKLAGTGLEGMDATFVFGAAQREAGFAEQTASLRGQIKDAKLREQVDTQISNLTALNNQNVAELKYAEDRFAEQKRMDSWQLKTDTERQEAEQAFLDKTEPVRRDIALFEVRLAEATAKKVAELATAESGAAKAAKKALEGDTFKDPITGETRRITGLTAAVTQVETAFVSGEATRREEGAREARALMTAETSKEVLARLDMQIAKQDILNTSKSAELDVENQLLAKRTERQGFTSEADAAQQKSLAYLVVETDKLNKLEQERLSTERSIAQLQQQLARKDIGETERADIEKKITDEIALSAIRKQSIVQTSEGQKRVLDATEFMSDRMKSLDSTMQGIFTGFGDALVDFALTGKQSFGDMVKSMLADLIRLEMKMQMMALYSSVRGSPTGGGLLSFAANLLPAFLGGSSAPTDFGTPGVSYTQPVSMPGSVVARPLAQGGIIDSFGIQKFAKGGTFTNSVVSSPTLFKFAKGTGLMGEAGPEAIMPLKRDAQGNLGVRSDAQQAKVDVVVNNYSSQPATTKETVDSRGNRKIEVVVGEMVAAEMSRAGSPANRAVLGATGSSRQPTVRR